MPFAEEAAPPQDSRAVASGDGLRVLNPYLLARLRALELRSPRFGAAVTRLRAGEVVTFIGTPADLQQVPINPLLAGGYMPWHRIAEFRAVPDPRTGRVDTLVVSVDLERIASRFRHAQVRPRVHRLVEEILVHEVWGHVVPVAEAGSFAANCADPAPGEPALDSCVMRRENDLRAALGWKPRRSHSFSP